MCIDPKKKEQMVRLGEKVKAARIKKGLMPQGLCKRAGFPSVERFPHWNQETICLAKAA